MKCPKCGSENIFYNTSYDGKDYYICGNCKTHYSLPTVAVSKTELTTAEMWEWLGKNFSVALEHRNGQKDRLEIAHGFWNFIAEENGFENCVRTAYEGAKKQEERNAKN